MLKIKNLKADIEKKSILNNFNLEIKPSEVRLRRQVSLPTVHGRADRELRVPFVLRPLEAVDGDGRT